MGTSMDPTVAHNLVDLHILNFFDNDFKIFITYYLFVHLLI